MLSEPVTCGRCGGDALKSVAQIVFPEGGDARSVAPQQLVFDIRCLDCGETESVIKQADSGPRT